MSTELNKKLLDAIESDENWYKGKGWGDQDIPNTTKIANECERIALQLVEDVALKFEEWNSTSDYAQQYWRSKRMYCEPKMGGQHIDRIREVRKDLFTYYINNIYGKQ